MIPVNLMLLEEFMRKGDQWVLMQGMSKVFGPKKPWDASMLDVFSSSGILDDLRLLNQKQNEEKDQWRTSNLPSVNFQNVSSPKKESLGQKKHQVRMSPKKRSSPIKHVLNMSPKKQTTEIGKAPLKESITEAAPPTDNADHSLLSLSSAIVQEIRAFSSTLSDNQVDSGNLSSLLSVNYQILLPQSTRLLS